MALLRERHARESLETAAAGHLAPAERAFVEGFLALLELPSSGDPDGGQAREHLARACGHLADVPDPWGVGAPAPPRRSHARDPTLAPGSTRHPKSARSASRASRRAPAVPGHGFGRANPGIGGGGPGWPGSSPLVRTSPMGPCGGQIELDFNAYHAGLAVPVLHGGEVLWGQFWTRDEGFPPPSDTNLTSAVWFTVLP